MSNDEKVVAAVVAGLAAAAAADVVMHRDKIQRSMEGQKQHYKTKDRSTAARLAHALAAHTATGRAMNWAFDRVASRRLKE